MGAALRCSYRRLTTQSPQQQVTQHLTTHADVLRTGIVLFFQFNCNSLRRILWSRGSKKTA